MHKLIICLLLCICLFYRCQTAEALEIVQPIEGQVFEVGSTVHVIVKPAIGENWIAVGIGFESLSYNARMGAYVRDFPLPKDDGDLGAYEFKVEALSESKQIVELKRKIVVVLPSGVMLKSIDAYPNPVFLSVLPIGSDPKRVAALGTEKLSIAGKYSDGVRRSFSDAAFNTTYTTSNERVVKVDSIGT